MACHVERGGQGHVCVRVQRLQPSHERDLSLDIRQRLPVLACGVDDAKQKRVAAGDELDVVEVVLL